MNEPAHPPVERLRELLDDGAEEDAIACLARFETAPEEDRKEALRALADERPAAIEPLLLGLVAFLTDEKRAVRLTAVKLFVAVAESEPEAVVPAVSALAERLADDEEFYYVRARAAEALGYVSLSRPDAVTSPEVLADLRIGLEFDEPEVREKLAKALECVALGDPKRLRHQAPTLAEHLSDNQELVRYHLCTTLVIIGCASADALAEAVKPLVARLDDESAFVRGRAAEALGLLAREDTVDALGPEVPESLLAMEDESEGEDETDAEGGDEDEAEEPFAVDRTRFALEGIRGTDVASEVSGVPDGIGIAEGVRETTHEAVEAITSPDGDGECPQCGLALGETGPPMCPRCGAPY